ncbi:hypothetical protein [Terribacillus saccharophilus]|uniref:hypothetical protein n=1 Tax=Terribacillus saccharophilus TaxID=361277 RepID=UPI003D2E2CB8
MANRIIGYNISITFGAHTEMTPEQREELLAKLNEIFLRGDGCSLELTPLFEEDNRDDE